MFKRRSYDRQRILKSIAIVCVGAFPGKRSLVYGMALSARATYGKSMGELRQCGKQIEPPHTQATVLVVDDDARILRVVGLMLSTEGYRVLKADGPEEAVRVFEQKADEIDLLLSDVMMPGMSGPELETRLHQVRPELPVILMTGNAAH